MGNNKYVHTTDVHNTRAAMEIVPVLIEWFHPKSVVDIGCGLGTWLYVFKSLGIKEILGIEGHHLNTDLLVIDRDEVILTDLEEELGIVRKFDLALSLEVAEHLSKASADCFIQSLTKLSDIIVFSAAIPGQGGQNHINEQWIGYWQSQFIKHDFVFTDEIRPLFWNNEKIEWWYKQNMVIAIKKGTRSPFTEIKPPLDLVHPGLFEPRNALINYLREINDTNNLMVSNLKKEIECFENENKRLKIRLDKTELELKTIYDSITWKFIYRFVINPITKIRRMLKHIHFLPN